MRTALSALRRRPRGDALRAALALRRLRRDARRRDLGADARTSPTARPRPSPRTCRLDATFDADRLDRQRVVRLQPATPGRTRHEGADLTFGPLATTQMACDGRRNAPSRRAYLASLGRRADVHGHGRSADDLRRGRRDHPRVRRRPARRADRASPGTRPASTTGRGGVASVVVGHRPDGRLRCGRDGLRATPAATSTTARPWSTATIIAIGPLVSTRMACADEAANDPGSGRSSRPSKRRRPASVHGSTLELRDADGCAPGLVRGRLTVGRIADPPGVRRGYRGGGYRRVMPSRDGGHLASPAMSAYARSVPGLWSPTHHDPLRHDVPVARPERAAVLRHPRRTVRGLLAAVHRSGPDRAARSGRGSLRLRHRERSRRPGAGLVIRRLTAP